MLTPRRLFAACQFIGRAVLRHWKKGVAASGAACVVTVVAALLIPRTYYSEAQMLVRFGGENRPDLTAELNSLIEMLKSRAILDRVVMELGPEYILHGHVARDSAAGARHGVTGYGPPSDERQQAVRKLEKCVLISAAPKDSIITVAAKAPSPEIAQQIVTKLVAIYLAEPLPVRHAPASDQLLEEQTRLAKAAWESEADRLRNAKNRLGVTTIDAKRQELEAQLGETTNRLLANQLELKTNAGKIAALQARIAMLPETIMAPAIASPSATPGGMRQSLSLLESQQQDLAAKMTDNHPKLAAVRQQIADLRESLGARPAEQKPVTQTTDPVRQSLERSLHNERSQANALRAKERSLDQQQQELRLALGKLDASAAEIERLQQQVTLAESTYNDYIRRLEQARMNHSLQAEQISGLSLVQPASYAAQPSEPRRAYVVVSGLLIAACSAAGTVLLAAWRNPVVTTTGQLAALLNIPLTGEIPSELVRFAS